MTIRQQHNNKVNGFFLLALGLHIPVFIWLSLTRDHSVMVTLLFSALILGGPLVLYVTKTLENILPAVMAFSAICCSGLLIHLGGGMIELHFHIFVTLASLCAYGLVSPIISAVLTAAVHHLGFFFFLPKSVFNYDASLGIVLLHAFFVIVEAVPTIYIAYQFSKMIELQDSTLSTLDSVSGEISTSLKSMNEAGGHLLTYSSETSTSIQMTSSSVEELNSAVKLNTENAKGAASLAQQSRAAAINGDKQVHDLLEAMKKISGSSQKIEEITAVIDDLAFQTNLLALNAAVEAARAGELGKGFAVVAEAVRSLAQKSSTAAKDISQLIRQSSDLVAEGVQYATKSEVALKEIVSSIDKVASLNGEISNASQEQSNGLFQITTAITKMDETAQAHTQTTSEITTMTDRIYSQSEKMRELLFNVHKTIGFAKEDKKAS